MARKKEKLSQWANSVTPFSKMLALFMLIVFPVLGFYYGIYYQKQLDSLQKSKTALLTYKTESSPTNTCLPPDGTISCRTSNDCPNGYLCEQGGQVVYHTNRSCFKKSHASAQTQQ